MEYIHLANNLFTGPLPDRFGEVGLSNLLGLAIFGNYFTGEIPKSLAGLGALASLSLHFNDFTGPVPEELCDASGLILLEADCGGDPAPNACSCCRTCCDRGDGTCQRLERRLALGDDLEGIGKEKEAEMMDFDPLLLPGKRRLQSNECTAQFRLDSQSGLLVPYEEEFSGSNPSGSPTLDPVPALSSNLVRRMELIDWAGVDLISHSPDAFESAVVWFNNDELIFTNAAWGLETSTGDTPEDKLNIQRFVLAWFWFHTTKDGDWPWVSCNPPDESKGENEFCDLLEISEVENIENELVMCYVSIPGEIRWLSKREECAWPGVNCDPDTQTNVIEIELFAVGLSGEFPSFLQLMPGLLSIQLTYGGISGTFPADMDGFKDIIQLVVVGHQLEDPFPESFFDMPLFTLNLGFNKFRGPLPEGLGNFQQIGGLYLNDNQFSGPLPESLSGAKSLEYLRLEFNPLQGSTLPASWGDLSNLKELYIQGSGLVGTIPEEYSKLTSMQNFRLFGNELEGTLPNMTEWADLERLIMQGNYLNGTFPEELL